MKPAASTPQRVPGTPHHRLHRLRVNPVGRPVVNYPAFTHKDEKHNLRIVAPRLWIGAEYAPLKIPAGPWALVVDLYGAPLEGGEDRRYQYANELIHWPFLDGDHFPEGLLPAILPRVRAARGSGPVLIHCQAGLSRSASATYAVLRLLDGLDHREAFARVYAGEPEFPRKTTIASARAFVEQAIARTLLQNLVRRGQRP